MHGEAAKLPSDVVGVGGTWGCRGQVGWSKNTEVYVLTGRGFSISKIDKILWIVYPKNYIFKYTYKTYHDFNYVFKDKIK